MIISPSDRIGKVKTYYFATKLAQIAQMNEEGAPIINLGIGSPDQLPPTAVIDKLGEASRGEDVNKYQSYTGLPQLKEAFADWYQRHFNVDVDPTKEVLPLIGSKEGIMHIAMSFLNPGDKVLVPDPGYPAYRMTTLLAGAEPLPFDLRADNDWQPDWEALEQEDLSKVKIMWVNYPNMPTGAKGSRALFEKLIAFGKKHSILICHDNPYGFILNDQPMSIMEVAGAEEVALELNSLSKCYNMSGWRVGVMVANQEVISSVLKFKSNMDSGMYKPLQIAATEALSQDQAWFDSLNEEYERRRKVVWEIMDILQCQYDKDSAGLFVWGLVPQDINDTEAWVEEILQKTRVFITPGFIFGTNGAKYIRISLCTSVEIFQEALRKIEKYIILEKSIA